MGLAEQIQMKFSGEIFSLAEVYDKFKDKPKTTVRARIYDNLGIRFEKLSRNVYRAVNGKSQCIVIEGDGRNLSMIEDESIDGIITDFPWESESNKGGNRNFSNTYECFKYTLNDFKEKARVLKEGHFLVEILPSENEKNYKELFKIKQMAEECGLKYYAKVPWVKGNFVSNTGRKAKNTEDIMIFSKGKPRKLRIDAKKTKATGETQFMSGTNGMLPTEFNFEPVPRNKKIHQSEKPTSLLKAIIQFISKPFELLLDQFAGSGSLGKAILESERNGILIEKSSENVTKIVDRLGAKKILSTEF